VGYRGADEVNPITGLGVVRDRHAHAWVEAWVEGRWQSFDPTPVSELVLRNRPSKWAHFTEALSLLWDRSVSFVASIGLFGTGVTAAVIAVVLIIVRQLTQRAARKKTTGEVVEDSRPLPAFETLSTALESAGFVRVASEPLERFARRVVSAGEPWSADVAEALERYAELRYGGVGEERAVVERMDAVAKRVAPLA
jgi:protein-glutamine gamma-glutamyltransferase